MKRKQIYISEELDKKLKNLAYILDESESAIIREALNEYLARTDKEKANHKETNPLLKIRLVLGKVN